MDSVFVLIGWVLGVFRSLGVPANLANHRGQLVVMARLLETQPRDMRLLYWSGHPLQRRSNSISQAETAHLTASVTCPVAESAQFQPGRVHGSPCSICFRHQSHSHRMPCGPQLARTCSATVTQPDWGLMICVHLQSVQMYSVRRRVNNV